MQKIINNIHKVLIQNQKLIFDTIHKQSQYAKLKKNSFRFSSFNMIYNFSNNEKSQKSFLSSDIYYKKINIQS